MGRQGEINRDEMAEASLSMSPKSGVCVSRKPLVSWDNVRPLSIHSPLGGFRHTAAVCRGQQRQVWRECEEGETAEREERRSLCSTWRMGGKG